MRFARLLIVPIFCALVGCGSMADDLAPSDDDRRPAVEAGSSGTSVSQRALDFSLPDVDGNPVTLAAALAGHKGIVLYFTMWCPVCDSHMSHMVQEIIPGQPDVAFYAVDYVSGSVAGARDAQAANGYLNSGLTVLADIDTSVILSYQGTMGTTVVIDAGGIVRMNEDYRNGSRLREILTALP